jgi:xylan 1,4-beta-xylosidase
MLALASTALHADGVRPVTVAVDATRTTGMLPPAWRFFGADEPNYATMKDGRKLLTELGRLRPGKVYFRAHNLLSTGDGTPAFKWGSTNIYTEDANGNAIYDYRVADRIIDTYRERGIRPYLQLGFMPEAMSTAPSGTPYQHAWRPGFDYQLIATGWTYPPKSYEKWGELIYRWTRHNVERYGADEVSQWYFEVWNEANSKFYWQGTPEEFYELHDVAVAAVRRALPTARVGGPDTAGPGGEFMDGFLEHVTRQGTPTDFLAFHAKGRPTFENGHVRMGISQHLKDVDGGFTKVLSVPALAKKPVVIGESDPEGCAACPGPQNAYRNGTMYSSYTVASFARIWELAERRHINLEGVLSWSFEFENQPWFAGYRQLATNGVILPVLNVFRMFAMLGAEKVSATSSAQVPLDVVMSEGIRGDADIGVLATRDHGGGGIQVLLWNYHDDDLPGADASIRVEVKGLPSHHDDWLFRVDGTHANAFAAWKAMGSPQSPNAAQYAELEKASEMIAERPGVSRRRGRTAVYEVVVPRQGVAILDIQAMLVEKK